MIQLLIHEIPLEFLRGVLSVSKIIIEDQFLERHYKEVSF